MGTHRNPAAENVTSLDAARFYRQHGYWQTPQLVQWMATARCSMGCGHCLCGAPESSDELQLDEVRELLDQLVELGAAELLITGGEPLERPDMPAVLELLAQRRIRYSLNTAVAPNRACREVMKRWPPSFVAVSLDGPRRYHDAFRKKLGAYAASLEAIALYRELTGGAVAAGTTITRHSLAFIEDTFRAVAESGASSWGLHLVVPEGRAAERPDLRLTSSDAKKLLAFVASRRQYFPITLADEIGYCGQLEPLVRDTPFFCGAGRAQCVVLPGGQVVPCTTMDLEQSAGSIRQRRLSEIWRDGFAALRRGDSDESCAGCRHLAVCQGGCWLQRRRGQHCYREAWGEPRSSVGKAGLAVCFGLAACGGSLQSGSDQAATTSAPAVSVEPATDGARSGDGNAAAASRQADAALMQCLVAKLREGGRSAESLGNLKRIIGSDPAWPAIRGYLQEKRPSDLQARVDRVRAAMGTKQSSLFMSSLLWRDLSEWSLDCSSPQARTAAERKLMRETLAALQQKTTDWRRQIFANKLDPFLFRDDPHPPRFMLTKALSPPPPGYRASLKHWGTFMSAKHHPITTAFLDSYPFAGNMRLAVKVPASGVSLVSAGKAKLVAGSATMGLFDVLVVAASEAPVAATVARISVASSRVTPKKGKAPREARRAELPVQLPAATELTFVDVVRLVYEQNREQLVPNRRSRESSPFDIPAQRERLVELLAQHAAPAEIEAQRWRLLQAWLF